MKLSQIEIEPVCFVNCIYYEDNTWHKTKPLHQYKCHFVLSYLPKERIIISFTVIVRTPSSLVKPPRNLGSDLL